MSSGQGLYSIAHLSPSLSLSPHKKLATLQGATSLPSTEGATCGVSRRKLCRLYFASHLPVLSLHPLFCLILMFFSPAPRFLFVFSSIFFFLFLFFMPRSWDLSSLVVSDFVFFVFCSGFFLVEFLFQSNSPGVLSRQRDQSPGSTPVSTHSSYFFLFFFFPKLFVLAEAKCVFFSSGFQLPASFINSWLIFGSIWSLFELFKKYIIKYKKKNIVFQKYQKKTNLIKRSQKIKGGTGKKRGNLRSAGCRMRQKKIKQNKKWEKIKVKWY